MITDLLDSFFGYLVIRFSNENWKFRKQNEEANRRITEVMRRQKIEQTYHKGRRSGRYERRGVAMEFSIRRK
jgi:hypothetical protein